MSHEGGCLCGAVRFRAEGEPENVRICHCRLCQKAMAAPFLARALFRQDRLSVTGPTAAYLSSPELERVFCTQCGTRVLARRTDGEFAGAPLALFDDRNAFQPECHMWVSEAVNWLQFDDGLPQHAEWPPG